MALQVDPRRSWPGNQLGSQSRPIGQMRCLSALLSNHKNDQSRHEPNILACCRIEQTGSQSVSFEWRWQGGHQVPHTEEHQRCSIREAPEHNVIGAHQRGSHSHDLDRPHPRLVAKRSRYPNQTHPPRHLRKVSGRLNQVLLCWDRTPSIGSRRTFWRYHHF